MTIIIVTGLSPKMALKILVKQLAKTINGNFEALTFANETYKSKDCYLRLSPHLDAVQVVENINQKNFGRCKLQAYIPDHVPEYVLSSKPKKIPQKMRRKLHIPVEEIPSGVLRMTHQNILAEMQYKYPGLSQLIKKTDTKLHKALSEIVHERLLQILKTNTDAREKCFNLSKYYRRSHPHFADFQLILSTLHEVEQSCGMPRSEVSEEELSAMPNHLKSIKINAGETLKGAVGTCSKMIIDQVMNHISQSDATPATNDTEEDVIRKKVRKELKNLLPYVPDMLKQVITNHFVPQRSMFIKMLMYGEPFLPNQDITRPFLKSYRALNVKRSDYMHNLMTFAIASANYEKLMAADGMLLKCGVKLLIRPASMPICRIKSNSSASAEQYQEDDDMEEDVVKDY